MRETKEHLYETIRTKDELIVALTHQRDAARLDAASSDELRRRAEARSRVALAALATISAVAEATR